jgi:hypothetical protein
VARTTRPAHLLLLYGSLEFPGFPAAAADAVAHGGPDRRASAVPGVEHISILYAPRAHFATVDWLNRNLGARAGGDLPPPSPLRRVGGTAFLTAAFLLGLYPLAGVLRHGRRWISGPGGRPAADPDRPARWWRAPALALDRRTAGAIGVAVGAAAIAVVVAPRLPTERLPIAIGGFLAGYTVVIGAVLTAYGIRRGRTPSAQPNGWRSVALVPYAGAAIAVPTNLGLTHAVPVGARWWLLPVLWAGFALLAYGTERATGGHPLGGLVIAAVVIVALTGAAVAGLTHGFVLLAVPPLVLLFGWQAVWSAQLNRLGAPAWLIAAVGSLVVAWPLGVALPLVG